MEEVMQTGHGNKRIYMHWSLTGLFFLLIFLLLLFSECVTVKKTTVIEISDDFIKRYTFNRESFGHSSLPFWYGLTPFERMALNRRDAAVAGDPEALFALAVFASGDVRDMDTYNKYLTRVKTFITGIRPAVEKADGAEQKGSLLFDAMCNTFFDQWAGGRELAGYRFDQSRLTEIFRSGKFNCISSSLLYIVCARYFNLLVKGVEIPSHIFVQLETEKGTVIDIETTVKNGYGIIHDEKFYSRSSQGWFRNRKLPQSTYRDYLQRKIHEPYILAVLNMFNQHTNPKRMATVDRNRLLEASGYLYPGNRLCVKNRLTVYNNEYVYFHKMNDYRTALRMYNAVNRFIDTLVTVWINDQAIAGYAAECMAQYYFTLLMNSREQDALAFLGEAVGLFKMPDSAIGILKNSLRIMTGNYVLKLSEQKEFNRGLTYLDHFTDIGAIADDFSSKKQFIYELWASSLWDTKNWEMAIDRYIKAIAFTDNSDDSLRLYDNIVAVYINWSNEFWNDGNWVQAIEKCSSAFVYAKSEDKSNKLSRNIAALYGNWGNTLLQNHEWQAAIEKYSRAQKQVTGTPQAEKYENDIAIALSNWAVQFFRRDEWERAIEKISQGLSYARNEETLKTLYDNLNAAYINWANELGRAGKKERQKAVLQRCAEQCHSCSQCNNLLSEL